MVIKQGRKRVTFLEKKTSGLVKLALYWPFRRTVKEPAEDLWGFRVDRIDYHHGLCFSSSFHLPYCSLWTFTKWNRYGNLQKHTSVAFKIFDLVRRIRRSTVSFHQRHGRAWFDRLQQSPGDEQTDAMWYALLARWNELDLCFIYGTSHRF